MPVKRKATTTLVRPTVNTYGYPEGYNQFIYDCWAFSDKLPVDRGVPPRPDLFRAIADTLLPGHFEWHNWTEMFVESACTQSLIGATGAAGSAKTFNASSFGALWWLTAPEKSSVMFVSTSVKMLRRRAWANISRVFSTLGANKRGNFIDSRMIWQNDYGDDLHSIFGKAVEEGSIIKVAEDIKGHHTERQMIILDEAPGIPPAIWDAISNLWAYPSEFVLVVMGNARSRMDTFGRWIEPKEGWTSVTVDDEEWEGKPQAEYGGRVPWILHFDAEKSPNIIEGKTVSRHLPQQAKVEAARRNAGNSPLYWSNMRGFPPPEGLTKTVFTETGLLQHDGFGTHRWQHPSLTNIIGSLDPAFGGNDNPVLTFAQMGITEKGEQWGIQAFPPVRIKLDVFRKETVHFQLADEVIRLCEQFEHNGVPYSCPLENLAVDATGEGGGLCSIIERKSGKHIIWIEYGGSASEDAVNLEDGRTAREVYRNKRAEIHFRAKDALESGQLKGINKEAAFELCTLKFDDEKKLIVLQSKKDYRREFGRSPDYGDSLVGLSEVARLRGFRLAAVERTMDRFEEWQDMARCSQEVYTNMYAPEEIEV